MVELTQLMQFLEEQLHVLNVLLVLFAQLKVRRLQFHVAQVISLHQALNNAKCVNPVSFVTQQQFPRLPRRQQLAQVFTA